MFLLFGIILICNTFPYVVLEKTEIPLSGQLVRFSTKFPGNVSSGILEVLSRYQYGHVCGRRFSLREADVVCKQLGFTRGALSTIFESTTSYDRRPTFEVKCDGRALTLQDCEIRLKVNCPDLNLAGVVCHENHGCPDGWTAGPTGCYEIPESMVTRRSYAITKCLKRSGHLVTIETEQENHFISNAFRNEEAGFILTGGLMKGSRWFWESVTSDAPSDNGTREPSSQTTKELSQIEYTKWFPGWVPGGIEAAPSGNKQSGCLFLSSVYNDPLGSITDVEYMFWMDDTCSSTRKRMSSGFRFMCERPFEQSKTDVGCYRGTGTDYRGRASVTQSGARCMKWTDAQGITPNTYPKMGLGDHNYCRNPDNDEAPWCWVSDGVFDFCDIPECVHEGQDNYPEDGLATVCKENEFTCNDYTCIPAYWQCDMEIDCSRGEDENQACEYDLGEFVLRTGMTVRDHLIEVYAGATNETCADYCLNATRFVCRSFSFKPRTRECILSDVNSLTTELRASSSEDTFELRIQLAGCDGMFECDNGRCVKRKQLCDGHDHCGDFSDETGCDDQGDGGVTVRLIDGASRQEGRVQVFYKGEWGGICDDAWDDDDAAVVCRMLGYTGPAKALKRPLLADISAPILLDDVACIGSEDSLVECSHNGWKVHDCFFWEMAGVRCSNASVRLEMDRVNPYGGRVFVTRDGVEGTVCDDLWGDADAKVVCRMLGYSGGKVLDGNWFSPSDVDIPILLDDVQCTGNETTIGDCRHAGWGEHNCGHAEDAGVQCLPPITQGDDVTSEDNDSDDSDDVTTKVTTAKTTTKTTSKTTATAAKTTASAVKTTATAAKTTPAPSTKFTQKPAVGKPIVGSRDCLNDTMPYIGKVSHTEKGFHCQAWSSDSPHAHKYHGGSMFPDGTVEAADNFCRSPDNDTQPWCYTTDPETRWDYCSVPKCKRKVVG
ncbi:hypothetical protein DPMN_025763 [Dreissena polymorpha]|uniref:Uncharacterized protein n=1 Tax=Dreissena polymorpha TaxID=45954 RepID=A0A9D4LS31_DREPO|nr:hypothetical protein DPMN_025763 [Dreissena polymorpha]